MTGDGVNDVLALKDADIGVAMGSGSPASRAVAQIVLLDNDFAALPSVVGEGRRVIGNIERVANLFLTKTVYAVLLALVVVLTQVPYPFLPRHLTLISSLTIGIPAFFLALAPNRERAQTNFVGRVMRFAVPAGAIGMGATAASYLYARSVYGGNLAAETSRRHPHPLPGRALGDGGDRPAVHLVAGAAGAGDGFRVRDRAGRAVPAGLLPAQPGRHPGPLDRGGDRGPRRRPAGTSLVPAPPPFHPHPLTRTPTPSR